MAGVEGIGLSFKTVLSVKICSCKRYFFQSIDLWHQSLLSREEIYGVNLNKEDCSKTEDIY